ncbi:hypothetical protein [Candidatus Clostridium stratigraminis]|uniref:Spore coat associated protein JA (CotJA) n=1 Tax=Candidatus Clostridium stratigraminis TaxID=3381661 RepID=A0ABW8T3M3_9CLOT
MYYRNDALEPNNFEPKEINAENNQQDRHKQTDKNYMGMPYNMFPMSQCPWMQTCPMRETCPMMGESKMMPQMDPGDPDPRFTHFHHFHHHFHHHFFHPHFQHFHRGF